MSGAVTTAVVSGVASAAVGAIAQSILSPDTGGSSNTPTPPSPTKPPASQAAQAPDAQGVRQNVSGQGQAGGSPGVASTFLTGATGVDPNQLQLGKATLLGG